MGILQGNKEKFKITTLSLALIMLFAGLSPLPGVAAEIPEVVYYGNGGAGAVLGNLGYTDVAGNNVWSREAIYETGALGIVKGFNNASMRFGRTVPLTREEAIAIAYRAAGREAEAQQLGIALNNIRTAANKKADPLDVW